MMDRNHLFNVLLSAMVFSTVAVLSALGEGRLDLYVSLFTLEYYVCSALLSPRRRAFDFLGAALLAAFATAVALRVAELLAK